MIPSVYVVHPGDVTYVYQISADATKFVNATSVNPMLITAVAYLVTSLVLSSDGVQEAIGSNFSQVADQSM